MELLLIILLFLMIVLLSFGETCDHKKFNIEQIDLEEKNGQIEIKQKEKCAKCGVRRITKL